MDIKSAKQCNEQKTEIFAQQIWDIPRSEVCVKTHMENMGFPRKGDYTHGKS